MANASERHVGYGDVRLHPLGIPLKHRPHLDVVLGDPEALLNPPQFAVAGEQLRMAHIERVGDDPFQPVPAGGLLDLVFVHLQSILPFDLDEPSEAAAGEHEFRINASVEFPDQLVDCLLPVGGGLSGPFSVPSNDDAATLVLELRRSGVLRAADRLVGFEVEDPLL